MLFFVLILWFFFSMLLENQEMVRFCVLILWVFFYFYFLVQASCTLEAGVKIYSLRVDSVHSEAYKVLGGINRAGREEDTGLGYGFFFFLRLICHFMISSLK